MTTTAFAGLASGRWTVDLAPSTATFRVSSLGRTVTGAVPIIEGVVDVADGGLPSAITGSLDLGAINTGNARRDRDLRKPRFLDLDRHPTMTFAADSVTASQAGWSVAGRLTARGATVRLAGDVEVSRQDRSAALTAHTWLDRRSGAGSTSPSPRRSAGYPISRRALPAARTSQSRGREHGRSGLSPCQRCRPGPGSR